MCVCLVLICKTRSFVANTSSVFAASVHTYLEDPVSKQPPPLENEFLNFVAFSAVGGGASGAAAPSLTHACVRATQVCVRKSTPAPRSSCERPRATPEERFQAVSGVAQAGAVACLLGWLFRKNPAKDGCNHCSRGGIVQVKGGAPTEAQLNRIILYAIANHEVVTWGEYATKMNVTLIAGLT